MSRDNGSPLASVALQRHCSVVHPSMFDTIVARSARVCVGLFRCPVDHPAFRDCGPTERSIVVFPRTRVRIQHAGSRPFLADPTIATIYNRGQEYERFAESADGDRCDWFGVDDELAREIAGAFDPRAADSSRPFTFQWAPTSAELYYAQRALIRRARHTALDALELEERVITIVASVLAAAHRRPMSHPAAGRAADRRRRELAEAARVELSANLHLNEPVKAVADRLGTSPFHLCRVFRDFAGQTMHEYRTQLRLRDSLERLESAAHSRATLSRLACDLGFASHSHYSMAVRRHFGATPTVVRRALA